MDKRSILFVLVLTLALFGVHTWFSMREEAKPPVVTQQHLKKGEALTEEKELGARRKASLAELPIVRLYADSRGEQFETLAVQIDLNFITFPWKSSAPKTLYFQNGNHFEKLELRIESNKPSSPLLYSEEKTKLPTLDMPSDRTLDVQLVYFSEDNQKASVALGEVINLQIRTPFEKVSKPAIALYKYAGKYLPCGIYNSASTSLITFGEFPYYSSVLKTPELEIPEPALAEGEKLYVIENEFQQLVFSNFGGALVEINLPLKSESHPNSVIRPIEFDKIFAQDHPQADYFPNTAHFIYDPQTKKPVLSTKRILGGYYPLVRRSIVGSGGRYVVRTPPRYYALNILSQNAKSEDVVVYKIRNMESDYIEFETTQSERKIIKRFSFPKDAKSAPYCIDLSIKVDGNARDLFITSGVPEVELMSGSFSPSLKYRLLTNKKSTIEQIDLPKTTLSLSSFEPDWVCNSNGFLGLIVDPLTEINPGLMAEKVPGEFDQTRLVVIGANKEIYPADKYPGYEIRLPLRNTSESQDFRIFAGPFASEVLKTIDKTYTDSKTGYTPDYIASQSFHGWFAFISEPFAKFLFFLMKAFYQISRSWGVSIILLTLALRIMLYPLNAWSIKSTSKMQEIAPKVSALQEKYKKDPKRAQMEIVALYREKGVNPFSGCLPILIQLPFLIGMFDLLKSTFELRGAPFIPYWIDNLTAPDHVFSWGFQIPFLGSDFHLLPILIGAVMYLQQKFSSPLPKDKTLLTDQQKQQKFMGNIMVIVFTVMFYNFPSGLNLYWLFSIIFGIIQQWLMTRKKVAAT